VRPIISCTHRLLSPSPHFLCTSLLDRRAAVQDANREDVQSWAFMVAGQSVTFCGFPGDGRGVRLPGTGPPKRTARTVVVVQQVLNRLRRRPPRDPRCPIPRSLPPGPGGLMPLAGLVRRVSMACLYLCSAAVESGAVPSSGANIRKANKRARNRRNPGGPVGVGTVVTSGVPGRTHREC
jgi:hypothetical protein